MHHFAAKVASRVVGDEMAHVFHSIPEGWVIECKWWGVGDWAHVADLSEMSSDHTVTKLETFRMHSSPSTGTRC